MPPPSTLVIFRGNSRRTSLQPPRHREERSDVAISCYAVQICTIPQEIATPSARNDVEIWRLVRLLCLCTDCFCVGGGMPPPYRINSIVPKGVNNCRVRRISLGLLQHATGPFALSSVPSHGISGSPCAAAPSADPGSRRGRSPRSPAAPARTCAAGRNGRSSAAPASRR